MSNTLDNNNKGDKLDIKILFLSSIGFSLGFSLMFFIISLPFLGLSQIELIKNYVRIIGGIVLIFFGLVLLNIIRIPALSRYLKLIDIKNRKQDDKVNVNKRGVIGILFSSIVVGISFSSGWAPCVGPVLISLLSLISNQQNIIDSIILLLIMSIGLMSGFLFTTSLIFIFKNIVSNLLKLSNLIEKILGISFIFIGFILILSKLNIFFSLKIGTDLLEKFSYNISSLSLVTTFVSFISGFFLFLSPCTLPLVIPYVFYITGISIRR